MKSNLNTTVSQIINIPLNLVWWYLAVASNSTFCGRSLVLGQFLIANVMRQGSSVIDLCEQFSIKVPIFYVWQMRKNKQTIVPVEF